MFLLEIVFSHGSQHKNRMQNKKDQKKGNFHLECSDRSRFETTGQVMSDKVSVWEDKTCVQARVLVGFNGGYSFGIKSGETN